MANANRPAGLSPVMYLNGAKWNGGGRVYCIPDTDDTNAYAVGDPVVLAGSADANGIPTITLATAGAGNPVLGPLVSPAGASLYGAPYGVPADTPVVIPATKSRSYYVLVCDDPNVIFEIQEDSLGANLAADDVGTNVNLVAGANNGYVSGWMLDSSSKGAGATIQTKLLQLSQTPPNAIGQYAKWLVLINNHVYRGGTAGL